MRAPAALIVAAALAHAGSAWGQAAPLPELYLEVTVNGESSGAVLRFTQGPRGLRSSLQNLRDLGLDPGLFGLAGVEEFDLADVRGLTHRFDPAAQTLALDVAPALRAPTAIGARVAPDVAAAGASAPGLLLNYQLFASPGQGGRTAALHELRWFNGSGVLSSSGITTMRGEGRAYTRYDTYWTRSDPAKLETIQIGDVITNSLTWSRSLRLGGVQWRKNFELRPDLLTYPVAALQGTAVVPTAVSLYVNGMQQMSTEVPSGPFVINQIGGLNGAGQASIVTRDALGRSIATTLPLYIDTRMMAAGLSDFSVEAGMLRRDYGTRSFGYASTPSASASLRHGWTETLTVEAHGEAGRGLVNAGAGTLWRLGQLGVFSGSLSASGGRQQGVQGGAGYQYISPRFSFDAQTTRASKEYADLATTEGAPPATRTDRASLNVSLPGNQGASISYVGFKTPGQDRTRVAALAYSATLFGRVFLSLGAYRDLDRKDARGVSFSLSFALGGRTTASMTGGRQEDRSSRNFTLNRPADYGGGFGWALQQGSLEDSRYSQAQLQYLGSAGQVTVLAQRAGADQRYALDASGSLVMMDGTILPARQVGAGFALVSTGMPGIPVVSENRPLGLTNGSGHLLVPNLIPYINNQLSIDTGALPADARVPVSSRTAVPQRLAGVLVRFPVEQYAAATVVLHGVDGKPLPVGTPVVDAASGAKAVVGYDGMAFVDGLQAHNRLKVGSGAALCEVQFDYAPAQGALPTIGPLVCRP